MIIPGNQYSKSEKLKTILKFIIETVISLK